MEAFIRVKTVGLTEGMEKTNLLFLGFEEKKIAPNFQAQMVSLMVKIIFQACVIENHEE